MTIRITLLVLSAGALTLTGCSTAESVAATGTAQHATVQDIAGSPLKRVTLSLQARTRLGITIAFVRAATPEAGGRTGLTVIPYSAVLYDVDGKAWAFTSSTGGAFQRASLTIHDIVGPNAYLSSGPTLGTAVVAVGAAELYGAELGVGK